MNSTNGFINKGLLPFGFLGYFWFDEADKYTQSVQTGSRAYGARRQHQAVETRNFVCAYMKRNDPVTRRFIQYAVMETCDIVVSVRDVKTGQFVVHPPPEEKWLIRQKAGIGRASRTAWEDVKVVDSDFYETLDVHRHWNFDFKQYYDIIIWDVEGGENFGHLYSTIAGLLFKAWRFKDGRDGYRPAEHILRSLTSEKDSYRSRDIQPHEVAKVKSVWDEMMDDGATLAVRVEGPGGKKSSQDLPESWLYSEADRLQDEILFPWDKTIRPESTETTDWLAVTEGRKEDEEYDDDEGENANSTAERILTSQRGKLHCFENHGIEWDRFINDLDTDEDMSDVEARMDEDELERGENGQLRLEHEDDDDDSLSDSSVLHEEYYKEMQEAEAAWHGTISAKELAKTHETKEDISEAFEVFMDRTRASSKWNSSLSRIIGISNFRAFDCKSLLTPFSSRRLQGGLAQSGSRAWCSGAIC